MQTQSHLSMHPAEGKGANSFFLFSHGTGAVCSRELSAAESSTKKARVQKGQDQHLELQMVLQQSAVCFFKQRMTTCPLP